MTTKVISLSKTTGRNLQKGAVAIIVALSLPVLIGMAGLALDLGKLYVTKTELQNASDACALAAAVELDGTASQYTNAEIKGIAIGKLNKSFFQTAEKDDNTTVVRTVRFATALNGPYYVKNVVVGAPADYKFVQCETRRPNIPNYLMPILNILKPTNNTTNPNPKPIPPASEVLAVAVASNRPGQSTCALPIGICSSNVPNSTPVGKWLEGTLSPGGGVSGSYRWVDFSSPKGGTDELAAILNGQKGQDCNLSPVSEDVEQSGARPSLRNDYNTRFGIEQGSAKGIPDFSGFSYYTTNWPSKFGAYNNFEAKRLINEPFQGEVNSGVELSGNISILSMSELITRGRDRRVAVAPVIDCSLFGSSNQKISVQRYVCVFLLHPMKTKGNKDFPMYLEYLGNVRNSGPCNQSGLAGAPNGIGPLVSALVQ